MVRALTPGYSKVLISDNVVASTRAPRKAIEMDIMMLGLVSASGESLIECELA